MRKSSDYWGNRLDAIAQNRFDKSYEETIEQIKKLYDDASENIKNEIEAMVIKLAEKGKLNRSDLYNFNRYIRLQKTINNELIKLGGKENKIFADLFDKEFLNVFNATRQEMGKYKEFCLYNPTMAKTIINMPWLGENYSSRIWKNTSKLSRVLKDNIEKTLLLGSSRSHMYKSVMDELKATVDDDMEKAYKNADRLIRTELMHTINESQRYCYKEAGYTKLEWLAYFDERTCDECASLNGTVVDITSKDVAPAHPRCRCTMIPVLESIKDADDSKTELTHEEEGAIKTYISGDGYKINEFLRTGSTLTTFYKEVITNLDSALEKMPRYSGDLSRSLHFDDEESLHDFLQDHSVGNEVTYPAYTSTTFGDTYNPNGQVQIYIFDSSKGRDISNFNQGELEVLYERNSKFRVLGSKRTKGVYLIYLVEDD